MPVIRVHRGSKPDLIYPLSTDHLIHLVQLNVYCALLANMLSQGRTSLVSCTTDLDERDGRIDLFPLPALRDALIRAHDDNDFDACARYAYVLGTIGNKTARSNGRSFKGHLPEKISERTGVVVWGDPWRTESWELEEGFVRRWGNLLTKGCEALLQSTDRWRKLRGDDAIDWTVLGVKV
ncbi:hypothetical protein SBRCBS47491_005679 [Sporothrix bragantina]|uniref:Uncharacterized protein n=1 Tax=Sporothrix bragantina TaxID=671064 RepID=A0ABP0BZE6_9PEZI